MKTPRPLPIAWFAVFALLFVLQVGPRLAGDSLTNDEPMEITNGYRYWTRGDVESFGYHPPLATAIQAMPLLLLGVRPPADGPDPEDRAFRFFFRDNLPLLKSMTVLPRTMTLLFALAAGLCLFFLTRSRPVAAAAALTLWAFEPTLLAFSGYALADAPVTFLFLAAVLVFGKAGRENGKRTALAAGALAGAAVCAKFSALILLPVFGVLEALDLLSRRGRAFAWKGALTRWGWGGLGFAAVVAILYSPGTLCLPGHRDPFHYFVSGVLDMVRYGGSQHPVYFMGGLSQGNHPLYFPAAFLLKSPIPLLLLLGSAVVLALRSRIQVEPWLWVPPALVFASILPVQNLGVRYLLPAAPFFILMASRAAAWMWEEGKARRRWMRTLVAGLLVWLSAGVALNFPHHASYFNDLVSRDRKAWWLADSNLDIGQDLARLARTGRRRGWREVKLAYFGAADPSAYGLSWRPWTQRDLDGPQPGRVYAVNAAFLQLAPAFFPDTLPLTLSWAVQRAPTGRVGDTWYYFEIPPEDPRPPRPDASPPLPSVPYLRGVPASR